MCQCRCGIGRALEGEWILKTAVILITGNDAGRT